MSFDRRAEIAGLDGHWLELYGQIERMVGRAKTGQAPEAPARASYYEMEAESTDRLPGDIIKIIRELRP